MKIRLDIPNEIYAALVRRARQDGIAVIDLMVRVVERMLTENFAKRVYLPVIQSKRPGSLCIDNATKFEIIDFP